MKNLAMVLAGTYSFLHFISSKMGWMRREHFVLRLLLKSVKSLTQSCEDTAVNSTE